MYKQSVNTEKKEMKVYGDLRKVFKCHAHVSLAIICQLMHTSYPADVHITN